tara:strand:- start:107 stop:751 length:645 start_codon:yes stop_codon:yes gene_type:complete
MADDQLKIFRPFGPSVAKVTIPENLINNLNNYVDQTIKDEEKIDDLNVGNKLAGNVKQEFKLEPKFVEKSGLLNFLGVSVTRWILMSERKKIQKFNVSSSWVVRQFENEYNPLHLHGGHISGVGYLKLPNNFGETFQKNKTNNYNGKIALVHGAQMFNCNSTFNVQPKVGDFYFFPNYLLHTVYPFYNSNEERRSISFNATIDENIYNTYNTYG